MVFPWRLSWRRREVKVLSVQQIVAHLNDRFDLLAGRDPTKLPHQQTMRTTIGWSHDLLEENQKALLARLSIFRGGWTLDAAENVCSGGEVEAWETLDLLTALFDKSLVSAEQQGKTFRYRLLETIRQYAWGATGGNGRDGCIAEASSGLLSVAG